MTRRTMLWLFALELSIVQIHGAQQDGWQSNSALGRQVLAAGRAHEAQRLFEQALRTAEAIETVPGRRVFISTSDLGAAYQAQKKFAEAEALDRKALEIARVAGIPDRELLPPLTNLAALLREMGRYAESESVYCRTLTIAEREMAPYHAQTYRILRELAFLSAAQGRPEEAEQDYLRALQPGESGEAIEADELVTTRSYLGDLYRKQGRYAESAAQYAQAMSLLEQASQKGRLRIGVLSRLGQLAADQGSFRRAESLYRTALGEAQKTLGPENEQAAAILNNLGHLYTSKENYGRAKETLEQARTMWGTARARIQNMVIGVSEGFSQELEINGVGYRAALAGNKLNLQLGFSHEVNYRIPQGITIKCEKPTSILISGADKQTVGQVAAEIRAHRPPEPYKGKGVKYIEETIIRKEGKKK